MPKPKHKVVKPPAHTMLDGRRAEIYGAYKKDSLRDKFIVGMQMLQTERYDEDEGALRVALGRFITARGKLMSERIKAIRASKSVDKAILIAEEETKSEAHILSKIESQVEVIGRLSERRAKLLGLNAPDKVALTDPLGNDPLPGLTTAQVIEIAAKCNAKPA